nr:cyclic AMP-responsive element-binding protein 1-like [Oncorhynchus nerka]
MTMEAGADTQQGGDTAVSESEAQQITLAQVSMAAGQVSSSGSTVTLVQLPNGQTVQVHGVIQAAQPSVIQSPQVQTVQVSPTPSITVVYCDIHSKLHAIGLGSRQQQVYI